MMLDWAQMMLATVGIGGVAALWIVKALVGVAALRLYRRWRLRRALRLGQGV
ncbi:MAG: hypothetical protein JXQ91_01135 [Vannielia sp.]|uniref:hypothetical protein n=1 Tax=Rhodobacterales TaxID=204455 RepID=UPI002094B3C7|nr:hypothetical protein [Oceanicola sp. 502str15]MCO6382468.1 hypothetical protein [Oceanicola sp. 502str15]